MKQPIDSDQYPEFQALFCLMAMHYNKKLDSFLTTDHCIQRLLGFSRVPLPMGSQCNKHRLHLKVTVFKFNLQKRFILHIEPLPK